MLDRLFRLTERHSTAAEVCAGIATFLTMAYILLVNPHILAQASLPAADVAVATALSAPLATLLMGLWANYPFALAPGVGLNAYFAFGVVLGMGVPWRTGLASVVTAGLFVLALFLALIFTAIPAFLTIVAMPFTYSIANGITLGLVSYVLVHALSGRARTVHPILYSLATLLLLYYAFVCT